MMKSNKKALNDVNKRGITLVEMIISLALMVLMFAAFATFIQGASALNRRTISLDNDITIAENLTVAAGGTGGGSVSVTVNGVSYDESVTMYYGTSNDVSLTRFEP